MAGLWLLAAVTMRSPSYLSTFLLNVGDIDEARARALEVKLSQIQGVAEAVVIAEDQVAYLKVDNKVLDKDALYTYSVDISN